MKTAAVTVLILASFGTSFALDCYTCFDCFDPLNTTSPDVLTETCENGSVCYAVLQEDPSLSFVVRQCRPQVECTATGCTTIPGLFSSCSYCCDDEDLCNGRSIEDGIKDAKHCYNCVYNATSGEGDACNDPFDATGEGVGVMACESDCAVAVTTVENHDLLVRTCYPALTPEDQCQNICTEFQGYQTCFSCCSGNLCNNGTAPWNDSSTGAPSTTGNSPTDAPSTTGTLPTGAPPTTVSKASLVATKVPAAAILVFYIICSILIQ